MIKIEKKGNFIIIILVLTIMLISCNEEVDRVKKVVFLDKGYGLYDYYIENGDTIMNGDFSIFDKNGRLKKKGKSVRNQFYGPYEDYYPYGQIESSRFRENNKDIGEITWFRPDGSLDTYNFYDDFGDVNFVAKYDEENNVKKAEGLILFEIYQFKLREENKQITYKLGDSIRYQFMSPNIPNTEKKFEFELKDYDNSKIVRKTKNINPVTLDVVDEIVKKGNNTVEARVWYKFKDRRKQTLTDTISFQFYVE